MLGNGLKFFLSGLHLYRESVKRNFPLNWLNLIILRQTDVYGYYVFHPLSISVSLSLYLFHFDHLELVSCWGGSPRAAMIASTGGIIFVAVGENQPL